MANLNTKKNGYIAENHAFHYLQMHGLQLIEKNYYCTLGEIDLIMQDREEIVFVEVRSRSKSVTNPIESIDFYKQTKLIKTALHFLQKKKWLDKASRFDVIGINNNQLEWIKNAFYADGF
jgi:putative endonuclease